MGIAIEKARDPYLRPREKYDIVVDCSGVAKRALQQAPFPGPGPGFGGFIQSNGGECNQVCRSAGRFSGLSREGALCASGENRPSSAFGSIQFIHGVWPNATPEPYNNAASVGGYCYKPGQKRDYDRTDITVGCFCN